MEPCFFQTRQLAAGYHNEPVLRDITVDVDRGEILTLIGPNGAGKSTLLKSIAGQLPLISGSVWLDGRKTSDMSRQELSRRMAVVFTDKTYTELMTCGDVAAGGRYPYTGRFGVLSKQDWEIVRGAMEKTHAADLWDRDFNRISDGQRQRVLLARALCQQPEILLLDEPVSYLDIRYKLEFLSTLQRLVKETRMSVIMSLHELDMAQRISDKVLCIGNGGMERFGPPEEIFRDGYIGRLFGVESGSYDEGNGTTELEAAQGEPQVFVLAGGGSGRDTYRRLQRNGTAFATGILYTHDLDYPPAKALACEVVSLPGGESMGEAQLKAAKKLVDVCGEVIVCRETFGPWEQMNRELWEYILKSGKRISGGKK